MNMFEPDSTELLIRTLEARKYTLRQVLSQQVLDHLGIDVATDHLYDQIAVTLAMTMYGERAAKAEAEETMAFPTTWWQHLKLQYAPEWFKARWPVKTDTWRLKVVADQWRMYANMDQPLPEAQWGKPFQTIDPRTYSAWKPYGP